MIKINKTSRFEDVHRRRQAGTMLLPLLSHPSSNENNGDMLLMIPHLQLKLLDNINEDINVSICNKNNDNNVGCKATVFQTSLNVTKICMGTSALALPSTSVVSGLLFNAIGLFVICAWITTWTIAY